MGLRCRCVSGREGVRALTGTVQVWSGREWKGRELMEERLPFDYGIEVVTLEVRALRGTLKLGYHMFHQCICIY